MGFVYNLYLDAPVPGVSRQMQGLNCILQRKDMGNQRLQIEDSSAQTCYSRRPCIAVSVDEPELDLVESISDPVSSHQPPPPP